MNVLLTGVPHSGKTTLLASIIEGEENRQGFVTKEMPDPEEQGQRVGFELVDAIGHHATLAHVDSDSETRVSRYGVEIDELDAFLPPLFKYGPNDLLYIDEIGQMELYSDIFKDLVREYLDATNNFIGTITTVYSDAFVDEVRSRDDVQIIEVTTENRDQLARELKF